MKKLYLVNVSMEVEDTIPVFAISEQEAEDIATDCISISDMDLDINASASVMTKCYEWMENEQVEGLSVGDRRTCLEIFNEVNKEKIQAAIVESWPKLPGFSDPPATKAEHNRRMMQS